MQWQRKTNLAGVVSQKKENTGPKFDETPGYDRKNRELYGNSAYAPAPKKGAKDLMTSGADWRNPQQTYTTAKDNVPSSLGEQFSGADQQRKARKANQLQSNVLTHADDSLREQRNQQYDTQGYSKISQNASNANWAAQTTF